MSYHTYHADATLTARATAVGIASSIWDLGSALLHTNYLPNSSGMLIHSPRSGSVFNVSESLMVGHGNSKSSNNICDSVIISGNGMSRGYNNNSSSSSIGTNGMRHRSNTTINSAGMTADNCTYGYGIDTNTGTNIGSSDSNSTCVRPSTSLLGIDSHCTNTTAFNHGKYKTSTQTIKDRKRDKERGMSLDSGMEDKISAYQTAPQTPGYGLGSYFGSFLASSLMKSAAVVGAVVGNTVPSQRVRVLGEENSINVTATASSGSTVQGLGSRVNNNVNSDMNMNSNSNDIYNGGESQCSNRMDKGSDSDISIKNKNGVHNNCDINSLNIIHTSHRSIGKDDTREMNIPGVSSCSSPLPSTKHNSKIVSDFISEDFSFTQQRELNNKSHSDTGIIPQSSDYLPLVSVSIESSDVKLDIAVQQIQKILQAVSVVGERKCYYLASILNIFPFHSLSFIKSFHPHATAIFTCKY